MKSDHVLVRARPSVGLVLPAIIADAGAGRPALLRVLHREHPEPEHAAGLPPGRRVLRLAQEQALTLGAIDRRTSRPTSSSSGPESRSDRQAGARRDPDAVRLARGRPGRAHEPRRLGARAEARRQDRQDARARRPTRRGAPRLDRHVGRRRASRPGAHRPHGLHLRPRRGRGRHASRGLLPEGKRWWVRLHEKGGKRHEMPAHHRGGVPRRLHRGRGHRGRQEGPALPDHRGRRRTLTANRCTAGRLGDGPSAGEGRGHRRAIGCHTFRATGITDYLENGGTLEKAQQMAAHESAKTTKLYDRTKMRYA